MLENDTYLVMRMTRLGSEYIEQTKSGRHLRSILVFVPRGHRTLHPDSALEVEYTFFVRETIWLNAKRIDRTKYVREAGRFVNRTLMLQSPKSREVAVHALRLLYSFLALERCSLLDMSYDTAIKLLDFFHNSRRYVVAGPVEARDSSTVTLYLTYVKSYLSWLGAASSHPLLRKKLATYRESDGVMNTISKNAVDTRRVHTEGIRYYIKPEEYVRARSSEALADPVDKILARCFIDLMFLHGLRLGECLSLTLEDIYAEEDGTTCIGIRNRFPGEGYRNAKGVINVTSRSEYTSKEYSRENVGYQIVYLDKLVVKDLDEYFRAVHLLRPPRRKTDRVKYKRHKAAYLERCTADTVADYIRSDALRKQMKLSSVANRSIDGKNHYFFLSRKYSPLRDKTWNAMLKKIFVAEGIPLDQGRRQFGLSHRFRHGFAMFLVRELHVDEFIAMKLMRHTSPASIEPYLKLTPEDVRNLRLKYTRSISEAIFQNKEGSTKDEDTKPYQD